jgi:adsorption protein B
MALLAIERGGQPFRADSLTEDYELGMLIGAYGLRTRFVDVLGTNGDRIASRGAFPISIETAVKQKSRWIAGIALAGWDSLGWIGLSHPHVERSGRDIWLARWMLWRDRRAPLAALVLLAAYAAMIGTTAGWAGQELLGWQRLPPGRAIWTLFAINAVLLMWRLGMRGFFTARWYGLGQSMLALPRAFVANVIAILAAQRAMMLYWRMLRSGQIIWEKTDHFHGTPAFESRRSRAVAS